MRDRLIAEHAVGWKNDKHVAQWRATFEGKDAATAAINELSVAEIDTALVLKVLRPIWKEKPETASRVRGRIERVLAWATVSEMRKGENPARWRGHLAEMLPAKSKIHKVAHHRAVAYGARARVHGEGARQERRVGARAGIHGADRRSHE